MFLNEWDVLIVDDDPDILRVTALALRDIEAYGLPVRLHTARSKHEALDLLRGRLRTHHRVAVALIDIVMESDHAGLELCQVIREDLRDTSVRIYVRTGQPGIAPERDVIDRYDISGYFTKTEATAEKLYSFVKSGIRGWFATYYTATLADQTYRVTALGSSTRRDLMSIMQPGREWPDDINLLNGIMLDNGAVSLGNSPVEELIEARDRLENIPPCFELPEGHKLVIDGDLLMVRVYESATTADYTYVTRFKMPIPSHLFELTLKSGLTLATLWKNTS